MDRVTVFLPKIKRIRRWLERCVSFKDRADLIQVCVEYRELSVKQITYEQCSCRGEVVDPDSCIKQDSYLLPEPVKQAPPVLPSSLSMFLPESLKINQGYFQSSLPPPQQPSQARSQHKQMLMSRKIDHPSFKPLSFQEAQDYLSVAEVEEIVIRPSSKGWDHLTISWKFYTDLNLHIDVKENDKPTRNALGRRLTVGSQEFEDLDHIIAQYIQPINSYARQLKLSPKFLAGTQELVERELEKDKQARPATIPYYFSIAYEKPGKFRLSYKASATRACEHEYISITPQGFYFRGRPFQDHERLTNHFKATGTLSRQSSSSSQRSSSSSSSSSSSAVPYGYSGASLLNAAADAFSISLLRPIRLSAASTCLHPTMIE